jgi:iron only hydrogenase large subunit-like protein
VQKDWVISTNVARCRDCYRCVRACRVKAVRVKEGQAQVVPDLCIACGSCVCACPQKAKSVRDDRPAVLKAMAEGKLVVASVAPSFPAFFPVESFSQLEEGLRSMGIRAAEETAVAAQMVGIDHKDFVDKNPDRWPVITSSCPAVVNLIEKYYPDLIPYLAPIVSPMVAHGRWLRNLFGKDAFVVFIGPCMAKKDEILDPLVGGAVDAVLTFEELQAWMTSENVEWPSKQEAGEKPSMLVARLFPVEGGLVGTANMDTGRLSSHIVTATGIETCEDILRSIQNGKLKASLIELMACEGGCINGPAMRNQGRGFSSFLARQQIIEYASRSHLKAVAPRDEWPVLHRAYRDKHVSVPEFTEDQIREVLKLAEKYSPEDELNCSACGYPTCRDKAIATLRGMAEATMCIPYMRRRAESIRQVVMDVSPDSVMIVNRELQVQDLSPSAEKMFRCFRLAVIGEPLERIIPEVRDFVLVRDSGKPVISQTVRIRQDLVVEQTIVPVKDHNLLVGILRDVTERESEHERLERIRSETLHRTQEVIKNQMRVAQEIAQLLGETTAETKMMLSRLARLIEEGGDR